MKSTALKVVAPLAVVVVIAAVVVVVVTSGGGAKQTSPSADATQQPRAVSERQIEALPPASEPIEVTNRLGMPGRIEEARLASEIPQRRYLYYPVKGAEKQLWELAFEDELLTGTGRCAVAVVLERGGGACSEPRRP